VGNAPTEHSGTSFLREMCPRSIPAPYFRGKWSAGTIGQAIFGGNALPGQTDGFFPGK